MKIVSGSLMIRNAEAADADTLCRWWNDGAVMAHAGFPLGLQTTAERIREQLATDDDSSRRRLVIEFERQPIGEMSYTLKNNTAEMGIKICEPDYQNRGLGTQLVSLLVQELFRRFDIKKVVLDTNPQNPRACHVYEKVGFVQMGRREHAWQDQLGVWQSAVDYELTRQRAQALNLI